MNSPDPIGDLIREGQGSVDAIFAAETVQKAADAFESLEEWAILSVERLLNGLIELRAENERLKQELADARESTVSPYLRQPPRSLEQVRAEIARREAAQREAMREKEVGQ